MTQYEHEEEKLERDLREGRISLAKYGEELREMHRSMRDEIQGLAEDAAERAYNDTIGSW